jgi:hypothetical protein
MEILHNNLVDISAALSGSSVMAKGGIYYLTGFSLDTVRIPPVGVGYILHIRLRVDVWKWGQYSAMDGKKRWVRQHYSFDPSEVTFVHDKTTPQEPIDSEVRR